MQPNLSTEPTFDFQIGCMSAFVLPGSHYVSSQKDLAICTVLGSCIAACLHDPTEYSGGLNHFLLPGDPGDVANSPQHHGVYAMEVLINDLLKRGSAKRNLVAKIFGGANMIAMSGKTVGEKNVEFVRDFLKSERIPVIDSDVGGNFGRRVYYYPTSGQATVRVLAKQNESDVIEAEKSLQSKIPNNGASVGGMELF